VTNEPLGKTNPLNPLGATLAEVQSIEEPESAVGSAASVVDKCCKKRLYPDFIILDIDCLINICRCLRCADPEQR